MYKLVVINIFFLLFSLNSSIASESPLKNVFFDAVEKNVSNLEILESNMSVLFILVGGVLPIVLQLIILSNYE